KRSCQLVKGSGSKVELVFLPSEGVRNARPPRRRSSPCSYSEARLTASACPATKETSVSLSELPIFTLNAVPIAVISVELAYTLNGRPLSLSTSKKASPSRETSLDKPSRPVL